MLGCVSVAVTVIAVPATPVPVDGVFDSTSLASGCSPIPVNVTFCVPPLTLTASVCTPSDVGRKETVNVQAVPAASGDALAHAVDPEDDGKVNIGLAVPVTLVNGDARVTGVVPRLVTVKVAVVAG